MAETSASANDGNLPPEAFISVQVLKETVVDPSTQIPTPSTVFDNLPSTDASISRETQHSSEAIAISGVKSSPNSFLSAQVTSPNSPLTSLLMASLAAFKSSCEGAVKFAPKVAVLNPDWSTGFPTLPTKATVWETNSVTPAFDSRQSSAMFKSADAETLSVILKSMGHLRSGRFVPHSCGTYSGRRAPLYCRLDFATSSRSAMRGDGHSCHGR